MRRCTIIAALLTYACLRAASLAAQERPPQHEQRVGGLPRDVARDVQSVWNAPNTKRVRGDFSLAAGDTVRGDVAVLVGRARIAGTILGQLVVINADAVLVDGASIAGALTVLGGGLESLDQPQVRGEIRVWSARLRYHEESDTLVADMDREVFARLARWRHDDNGQSSQLFFTTAHTYNRVEGLPLYFGPRFYAQNGDTRVNGELLGIFRTGDKLEWTRASRGHRAMFELRQGRQGGALIGGRLFDLVTPVEDWQLSDGEVGLASFLFTRDYRDYWQRHGGAGYVSFFTGRGSELRASFGEERWSSRRSLSALSLFNSDKSWRANPQADEGVLHMLTLTGLLDTRNNPENPRTGWLLRGEYEHGQGTLDRVATSTIGVRAQTTGDMQYARGLLDVRRYNRLGPSTQINLRAVLAGWLNGDALPMQRRLSVSGIDALPGFDFRRTLGNPDAGTCATGNDAVYVQLGRPAQCDRMLLLQAEWKGDFRIRLFGDRDYLGDRRWSLSRLGGDGSWVVFANTGRGWLVGDATNDGRYGKGSVPGIGTWRSDLGGGFDFGTVGVYLAEAVSQGGLQPNVYVRLGHRF